MGSTCCVLSCACTECHVVSLRLRLRSQGCPAEFLLLGCYAVLDSNRTMPKKILHEPMSAEVRPKVLGFFFLCWVGAGGGMDAMRRHPCVGVLLRPQVAAPALRCALFSLYVVVVTRGPRTSWIEWLVCLLLKRTTMFLSLRCATCSATMA